MIDLIVKATLLLVAGLIAWGLAGKSSAATRHLTLATTFGTLFALPLVIASAPEIAVPIPASRVEAQSQPVEGRAATAEVVMRPEPASMLPAWPILLSAVWMTGTMLLLVSLAVDLWRLRRFRQNGLPAPELRTIFQPLTSASGIRRPVELLLHESIPAPITCGLVRPAILLPVDALSWSEDNLRRALIHEMEHVRRLDWPMQIVARAVCAFYWFHPLVWVAVRKLSLEAERSCDDAVVRGEESTDYAEQLLTLARRMSNNPGQAALGMAHRSDLSTRVTSLLDGRQRRGRAGVWATAGAVFVACALVFSVGPMRAVAQPSLDLRSTPFDRVLFEAAEKKDLPAMERVVALGANVNAKLDGDGSPLIAAARRGHNAAIAYLLDRGADPNMPVSGDGSPLIVASQKGHLSTAKLLLDRGADVRLPVPGDGNPLIMAARGGNVDMLQFLLERGADIEQVVPGDENALIEASASGNLPAVKFLVNRGANIQARIQVDNGREGEWRSALNMARRRKHAAVVSYLESVGAHE